MPSEVSMSGADEVPRRTLEELERELAEAREQQAATAEILAAISSSPTDVHHIFAQIAVSAAHLCRASNAGILQVDGDHLRLVAHHGPIRVDSVTMPLARGFVAGRSVIERRTLHVADLQVETEDYLEGSEFARRLGYHTILVVPLIGGDKAFGAILIRRTEVRPFTDRQIALLKTFADQAVIAIENTRLFEEVQARTKELQTSLNRQTATGEVLGVISRSPSQTQPVFAAIVATAARLCRAEYALIFKRESDERYHVAAANNAEAEWLRFSTDNPIPPGRGSLVGRTALEGRVVHIPDCLADPEFTFHAFQRVYKFRTMLGVPLLRRGSPAGVIALVRNAVEPFSDTEIDLVTTFADQAVIAIENTWLFESEQARTKELTESLEYQTALADVLGIISRSPSNLQPVLDAIAASARELCAASDAVIERLEGDRFYNAAHSGTQMKGLVGLPLPLTRQFPGGRAVLDQKAVTIDDIGLVAESEYPDSLDLLKLNTIHSVAEVPLLSEGRPLGSLAILRAEVRPFTKKEVAMLESFASQAVIAIENTRLFEEVQARTTELQARSRELQKSLEQQTAISEILRVISSSPTDIQPVLDAVAERAARICEARIADIFFAKDQKLHVAATFGELGRLPIGGTVQLDRTTVMGRSIVDKRPVHVADLQNAGGEFPLGREYALRFGQRTTLAVPLVREDRALGTILVRRAEVRPFEEHHIALLTTFADQAAIAIENVRLFNEIVEKSRELEIASQHKSQFVANMSHELRTPLAAMLGYAELLQEGIYDALPEKSLPILTRIRSNGKHLLGLINTVLDISKIEAGQFKQNLGEYALGSIVETVMGATESLAATKKLTFKTEVANGLPYGLGDEQRLTQVLLNLVGNAIKFTDAGEVRITAGAANGRFELSVIDTGPGIPPEERERIFEKFRQVDSSNTRTKGGTGLGLAIAREIVEMHGGRIWVESTLGQGSTFRMELPVRAAADAGAA
jgi:signal transduction histidine kinase/putative methionine-R-sulfoxide reductase with GAF domain